VKGPVIAGADGSDTSRLAIEGAACIARGSDLPVVVTYVRHAPLVGLGAPLTGGLSVAPAREAMTGIESLVEAQSIAILDPLSIPWRIEVREGDPVTELMNVAMECGSDMIVVAGRRHGAVGGIAHGSVGSHLLYRWPRSLMIIHPRAEVKGPTRLTDADPPPVR
jgi:nucleotide-binding universal stress UspA family protein